MVAGEERIVQSKEAGAKGCAYAKKAAGRGLPAAFLSFNRNER
jgi:hypothetical protein